jgi:hypothetical protein
MPYEVNSNGQMVYIPNVVNNDELKEIRKGLRNLKGRVAGWSELIRIIQSCSEKIPDTGHTDDCLNYVSSNKTITEVKSHAEEYISREVEQHGHAGGGPREAASAWG